jgi:formylglycine-generating enzyme required for sulfatase activity
LAGALLSISRNRLCAWRRSFAILVVSVFAAAPHVAYAVTIETVPIGNPGNQADTRYDANGLGSVPYSFRIGATEITNSQYVEFLNAVAASDALWLYDESMADASYGGIVRSGEPGSYTYSVKPPAVGQSPGGTDYYYENKPVVYVDWFRAVRFTNWLHNGQQGPGTTEDGAYTLLGGTPIPTNHETVTRNAAARWWIPSLDEWYKAAYYHPVNETYYDYPTFNNSPPNNNLPVNDAGNSANFSDANGVPSTGIFDFPLTDVGAYTLTKSSYNTFDQGGNVQEWTDTKLGGGRPTPGGSWFDDLVYLHASSFGVASSDTSDFNFVGFRVATIPDLPGDFNHDGSVDAADYVVWRKGLGTTYTQADFNTWRANFGATLYTGSAAGATGAVLSGSSASPVVPEPTSLLLFALTSASFFFTRRRSGSQPSLLAICLALAAAPQATYAVTIVKVPIGNPGNQADSQFAFGYYNIGAVAYSFKIGKTEVTNAQYVDFLNAVAATDSYNLYNTNMGSDTRGGIVRSGSSGSFTYAVKDSPLSGAYEYGDKPVVWVSFSDAMRFANWLHNGQPTDLQNASTTEDGAYTLNGATTDEALAAVTRNSQARWWLPNEDEWYKAAYHNNDGVSGNYWDYPTGSDSVPNNSPPSSDTGNSANFWDGNFTTGDFDFPLTDAGAYTLSQSPYGTLDQGGNVWEWNDTIYNYWDRGVRGGGWPYLNSSWGLHAANYGLELPPDESNYIGFRVAAAIPEPGSLFLLFSGLAAIRSLRSRR